MLAMSWEKHDYLSFTVSSWGVCADVCGSLLCLELSIWCQSTTEKCISHLCIALKRTASSGSGKRTLLKLFPISWSDWVLDRYIGSLLKNDALLGTNGVPDLRPKAKDWRTVASFGLHAIKAAFFSFSVTFWRSRSCTEGRWLMT